MVYDGRNRQYREDMEMTMKVVNQRPGRMIQLASLLNRYNSKPKYYGDNDSITLIEQGILFYIYSNPGVNSYTLCEQFGRTRGAISQLIHKLEEKNYIQREASPNDAKSFCFYPTLAGLQLINKINENDKQNPNGTLLKLLDLCSIEDIQTFFRMIDIYINILIMQISAENEEASSEALSLGNLEESNLNKIT